MAAWEGDGVLGLSRAPAPGPESALTPVEAWAPPPDLAFGVTVASFRRPGLSESRDLPL